MATAITPIVLWSEGCQGNLYLKGKNTFLEFYTEENAALKRNANARSASADSHLNRNNFSSEVEDASQQRRKSMDQITTATDIPTSRSISLSGPWSESSEDQPESPRNAGKNWQSKSKGLLSPEPAPSTNTYCSSTVTTPGSPTCKVNRSPSFSNSPKSPTAANDLGYATNAMTTVDSPGLSKKASFNENQNEIKPQGKASQAKSHKRQNIKTKKCNEVVNFPQEPVSPTLTISLNQALNNLAHGGQSTQATVTPPNQSPSAPNPQMVKSYHAKSDPASPKTPQSAKRAANRKHDTRKPPFTKSNTFLKEKTLMMRGIPCSFSQDHLRSLIDDAGLRGKYDFFYLPRDGDRNANLGYAFVNFVDEQSAQHCTSTFTGVQLAPFRSAKSCTVVPAAIQGLQGLWEHFRNTAVSCDSSYGPVFLNLNIDKGYHHRSF